MRAKTFARLRKNFVTGLAVLLPAAISISVVVWLYGKVSKVTDKLLFAVPREWKYVGGVRGEFHWYWSLIGLLLAVALVVLAGRLARHYMGKKLINITDNLLLRVPLLSTIYATVKQVKEAFSGHRSSFRDTVLVEFPRPGIYSLGFITSSQQNELQVKTAETVCSVFVPTTPNITTGFLIFIPESRMIRLEMSIADAIKAIISLGAVMPEYRAPPLAQPL